LIVDVAGNPTLRRGLDEAIRESTVGEHEVLITKLRAVIPHSVSVVAEDDPQRPSRSESDYVCFDFALGLTESTVYACALKHYSLKRAADAAFVHWLILQQEIREIERYECARDEDLIVYFGAETELYLLGEPKHAGKLRRGRVISKWGKGLLYEHDLAEVPESYGYECRFFKAVTVLRVEGAFERCWSGKHNMTNST
jgi:hypothetical protein